MINYALYGFPIVAEDFQIADDHLSSLHGEYIVKLYGRTVFARE